MLWERKPALPEAEHQHAEFIPINMRKPKGAWMDSVGMIPNTRRNGETVLGRTAILKGDLSLNEDLVIEGQFEGNLTVHNCRVTIGIDAIVKSDISAGEAIVLGRVEGNVSAQQRIEIRKTGHAVGDLIAPGIVIESGAFFKGKIEILNGDEKQEAS